MMTTTILKKHASETLTAIKALKVFTATEKRKSSIARVILSPGEGKMLINGRSTENYFPREILRYILQQPLSVTGTENQFDIKANITGGGVSSQADALKYGIAKALLSINPDYRKPLKTAGFLTRDSRIVERKKYGRHKARRRPHYSKR